jgi:hypothetical protein
VFAVHERYQKEVFRGVLKARCFHKLTSRLRRRYSVGEGTMVPAEESCCKMVYHRNGNWGRSIQCAKRGTHEHEGKRYCGVHFPPNVEKRNQRLSAKYDADSARYKWRSDLEKAERDLVAAAIEWKESNSYDLDYGPDRELIEKICAYTTLRDNPR